jgi:hypothetical protein
MKLTIDRDKWLRGEGSDNSALIRSADGKMCCLGFLGVACKIPKRALTSVPSPICVHSKFQNRKVWKHLFDADENVNNSLCQQLIVANDSAHNKATKETRIATLFRKIGVEVEFVG